MSQHRGFEQLLHLAIELAGVQRAALIVMHRSGLRIEAEVRAQQAGVVMVTRDDPLTDFELPRSALDHVLRSRQSLLINDLTRPPSESAEWPPQRGPRSALFVPLLAQAQVIGALYVESDAADRAFSAPWRAVVESLASQAATVLENARLTAALGRSEALLAQTERLSSTGSFSWRPLTHEFRCSRQTLAIFDFDPTAPPTLEMIGLRVHPQDVSLLQEMFDQGRGRGGDLDYELRLQMPDGSDKHVRLLAHEYRDDQGQLEYIGAIHDVTGLRGLEQALAKSRADLTHVARVSSLGRLAASIAHEVTQPLSGIITNAGTCLAMLSADPPDLGAARDTARRIIRDTDRAVGVVARLRALFVKRAPTLNLVDLNLAAREVATLCSWDLQKAGVALQEEYSDPLPPVVGDRVQLQQVILNLVLNAADAMRTVDDRERLLIIKTQWDGADQVHLSVRDAGVGFEPQRLDTLFEPFYTTKSEGMGIGLSVSRCIIEGHHGRLWALLNEGPGATFAFALPCTSNVNQSAPQIAR
jgi:signal transduction histidine kinase